MSRNLFPMTWEDFDAAVHVLASGLSPIAEHAVGVYGAPRGGLPLAVALSHALDLPLLLAPAKGMIFVDDIVDSGLTWQAYMADAIAGATWVLRDMQHTRGQTPLHFAELVPCDEWIVFPWEQLAKAEEDRREYVLSRQ